MMKRLDKKKVSPDLLCTFWCANCVSSSLHLWHLASPQMVCPGRLHPRVRLIHPEGRGAVTLGGVGPSAGKSRPHLHNTLQQDRSKNISLNYYLTRLLLLSNSNETLDWWLKQLFSSRFLYQVLSDLTVYL